MTRRSPSKVWLAGAWSVLGLLSACGLPAGWQRPASHVGLGAVLAIEDLDLDDAEDDSGLDLEAEDAWGGELRLGRRVHRQVELELHGQAFDALEIDASDGSRAELDLWALTLDVKLYEDPRDRWLPELGPGCTPYLVLGLGGLWADLDDPAGFLGPLDSWAGVGRGGLGLELFVSESLAWFLEASLLEPFDDLDGLTLYALSTGLQWRF